MKIFLQTCVLLSLFVLQGCTKEDPVQPGATAITETGIFTDSPVSGLNYSTETKSGKTDAKGKFEYVEGEIVTFSVGDIVLGSGIAKDNMSPIDIASTVNANINSFEVKNIAAFLQSLDSDSDPSNGILLAESIINAIDVSTIDFTKPIEKLLGEIISEVNIVTGSSLTVVYPEQAALHLADNLNMQYTVQNNTFVIFTPTIEDWIPKPPTSIYWVHETNEEGKIIASNLYEKYPNRIVYEQVYKEYNSAALPISYELKIYEEGRLKSAEFVEVSYSEKSSISRLTKSDLDGSRSEVVRFVDLDSEYRVKEAEIQIQNENFQTVFREVYTHLPNGNRKMKIHYADGDFEPINSAAFSYTSAGDYAMIKTEMLLQNYTATQTFEYRDDYTLKSWIRNDPGALSTGRTEEMFFDEEERKLRWKVTTGDYVTEFLYNVNGEGTKVVETYYQGLLIEVITEFSDGTSVWKTISTDGSFKLEYKDASSNIIRTEYYDSEGNLIS